MTAPREGLEPVVRVWRVGRFYTALDRAYADGLRSVATLEYGCDPGEPEELLMTPGEWAALAPTAVCVREEKRG